MLIVHAQYEFGEVMETPLITIGILCYNAENTIGRALDCALSQEWENVEILVVDDGSCDGSVEIVNGYAAKYSHIHTILHETNKGTAKARNTVLDNFRGEYLTFFDDDDYSYPSRLNEQYRRLVNFYSPFALCYCNREVVDPQGLRPCKVVKGIGWRPLEPYGKIAVDHWLLDESDPKYCWGSVGAGCLMAHRDTFARIGHFDPEMLRAEDIEYAIQGAELGCHFVSADASLICQHLTLGSDKNFQRGLQSHMHIVRKYEKYLTANGLYWYSWVMAYAQAYEIRHNKWRFKLLRSLAKRIRTLSSLFLEWRSNKGRYLK